VILFVSYDLEATTGRWKLHFRKMVLCTWWC